MVEKNKTLKTNNTQRKIQPLKKNTCISTLPNSTTNQQETNTDTQEENLSLTVQTLPHPQW